VLKEDKIKLHWDSKGSTILDEKEIAHQTIEFINPCQTSSNDSIFDLWIQKNDQVRTEEPNGRIFRADNLLLMKFLIDNGYRESFDLIYIDPPYLSSSAYNSTVKIKETANNTSDYVSRPVFLDHGTDGMEEYLNHIYPRLKMMKELLSVKGSLFVHLDWHISHYVKILLDEIFSSANFINEIVWCYGGGSGSKRHFHRKHDMILWYGKDKEYIFHPQYRPYTAGTLERGLTRVKGDKYQLHQEGALMQDWWTDINKILSPTAAENLKFPTQKPEALLKRIILAASNQGSLVADFYAGSGTMASVSQELGRRWIICDESPIAIQTSLERLIKQGVGPFTLEEISDAYQPPAEPCFQMRQREPSPVASYLRMKPPSIQPFNESSALMLLIIEDYKAQESNLASLKEDWGFKNLIDFWEVDLNYDGNIFNSEVQVLRDKKVYDDSLSTSIKLRVPLRNEYQVAIKVYDIFGDSTMQVLEWSK